MCEKYETLNSPLKLQILCLHLHIFYISTLVVHYLRNYIHMNKFIFLRDEIVNLHIIAFLFNLSLIFSYYSPHQQEK